MKEPMDAYEFSFVAVPAQRESGVLKGLGAGRRCLKELAEEFGAQNEYRALWKQAQLGQAYEKQLRNDVVRLCLILDLGVERDVLTKVLEKAAAEELVAMKDALEMKSAQLFPAQAQLMQKQTHQPVENGFLV